MNLTRLSFLYLIGYIVPSGLLLLLVPETALTLLQSNGSYGDVMPRLAGGAILALGIIVVQIWRHRIEALYLTTVGVRVVLSGVLAWLFTRSHDPFFVVVGGVVALGMLLTASAYVLDTSKQRGSPARNGRAPA